MRFLVSLSSISLLHSTFANPLLGDSDDTNLFIDSDADSLFPDDLTRLPPSFADSTLDQASLADENLDFHDWSDSTELAGVDDFCAADEEIQTIGKLRVRDEASSSCTSPGSNVNLLNLPNIFQIFKKVNPSTQPDSETKKSPPAGGPGASFDENECLEPFFHHLCCVHPAPNSLDIVGGITFYNTMEICTPGKYLIESPHVHTAYCSF